MVRKLRKEEKRKEMFEFAIDMVDQIPDRRKIFGIFEKNPEKVRILPGLNFLKKKVNKENLCELKERIQCKIRFNHRHQK